MPTNHHHGHAHANNKDKGYVISTHSVISPPPRSQSPNPQDLQNQQPGYEANTLESRCGSGRVSQYSPSALHPYLGPNVRGGQGISDSHSSSRSGTVSSSTTHVIGGSSTAAKLPKTSPPTRTVASSSRLSTLLLSTSSLRSTTTCSQQTLSINSPSSGNQTSSLANWTSQKQQRSDDSTAIKEEGSPTNEATQKNLLLKQLLNVNFPSSSSASAAATAAAAQAAAAAAATSNISNKGDTSAKSLPLKSENNSPPSPSTQSRILQLLSQNNDNPQQNQHHRLSDRSQSYGLPNNSTLHRQLQNVPSSSRSLPMPSTSAIVTPTLPSNSSILDGTSSNSLIGSRQTLKRAASDPLGGVSGAKQQTPPQQQTTLSAVCSENPSLASLLSKPPAQASRTVPPPVPTKWHQEPKEKLPRDIMRKFLPPHPAERASSSASRYKGVSTAGEVDGSSLLQPVTAPTSASISNKFTTSAAILAASKLRSGMMESTSSFSSSTTSTASSSSSISSSSVMSSVSPNIPISSPVTSSSLRESPSNQKLSLDILNASQLTNTTPSLSGVSNSQSCVLSEPSDDDPMLDAILNDVIEIQEKSPPLTGVGSQGRVGISNKRNSRISGIRNNINSGSSQSSPASAAILAEHSQISDIEKYLASAENTPPRENSPSPSVPMLRTGVLN